MSVNIRLLLEGSWFKVCTNLLALAARRRRRNRRQRQRHGGQRRRVVQLVVLDVRRRRTFRDRMTDRRFHRILVVVSGGPEFRRLEGVHGRVVEEPPPPAGLLCEVDERVGQGSSTNLVHQRQRRVDW